MARTNLHNPSTSTHRWVLLRTVLAIVFTLNPLATGRALEPLAVDPEPTEAPADLIQQEPSVEQVEELPVVETQLPVEPTIEPPPVEPTSPLPVESTQPELIEPSTAPTGEPTDTPTDGPPTEIFATEQPDNRLETRRRDPREIGGAQHASRRPRSPTAAV